MSSFEGDLLTLFYRIKDFNAELTNIIESMETEALALKAALHVEEDLRLAKAQVQAALPAALPGDIPEKPEQYWDDKTCTWSDQKPVREGELDIF